MFKFTEFTQPNQNVSNVVKNLPANVTGGGNTTVDAAVVNSVNTQLLNTAGDPKSGAQALNQSIATSNAVSVAQGYAQAVATASAQATVITHSFAQLCINAVQTQNIAFSLKCVSSFSLSIIYLVVIGETTVARTCVTAFTSYIIQQGGCAQYVNIIIQSFIQIIISIGANVSTYVF